MADVIQTSMPAVPGQIEQTALLNNTIYNSVRSSYVGKYIPWVRTNILAEPFFYNYTKKNIEKAGEYVGIRFLNPSDLINSKAIPVMESFNLELANYLMLYDYDPKDHNKFPEDYCIKDIPDMELRRYLFEKRLKIVEEYWKNCNIGNTIQSTVRSTTQDKDINQINRKFIERKIFDCLMEESAVFLRTEVLRQKQKRILNQKIGSICPYLSKEEKINNEINQKEKSVYHNFYESLLTPTKEREIDSVIEWCNQVRMMIPVTEPYCKRNLEQFKQARKQEFINMGVDVSNMKEIDDPLFYALSASMHKQFQQYQYENPDNNYNSLEEKILKETFMYEIVHNMGELLFEHIFSIFPDFSKKQESAPLYKDSQTTVITSEQRRATR